MNEIWSPIFISGPHGGGKSTLIEKLKSVIDLFLENDFDIDFTIDFPSIVSLSHFERSLIRLYHRFFVANYAQSLSKRNPEKIILTNRTIYDSEAYINTYRKLNWISEDQYKKLHFVINNFSYHPHTIILNPPLEIIEKRLDKRREGATRENRDKIFEGEDSVIFLENLHDYFKGFRDRNNILYIEDNNEAEIKKIIDWVKNIK